MREGRTSRDARRRRGEVAYALAAAALALLAAAMVLRLWHASIDEPLAYTGDARLYLAIVDETISDGWYLENDRLAAPFGQQLYEYPLEGGSAVPWLAVALLGPLAGTLFATANVFFVIGFAAVALVTFLVMRALRLSRSAALVCAVLYALLPYHFYRGPYHLFLSAYYAVPLGCYLVLRALGRRPLLGGRAATASTLAICVLVGTGGTYYAAFTVVLLFAAGTVAALAARRVAPLVQGLAPAAAIALVLVLEHLPSIVHLAAHGGTAAATREPRESELFSLKLADLVLPLQTHRLGFLADVTRRYRAETPLPSEAGATLGTLGTVAFVSLLGVVLVLAAGGRRWRPRPLMRAAAVATLLALLIASTGAGSTLIAYLVTPQFRAWSRFAAFIAFFALVALGTGLDRIRVLLRARGRSPAVAGAAFAVVLVVGLLDQTSDAFVPAYSENGAHAAADRGFVRAVEKRLPSGAAVYQLPYVPFPESPEQVPGRMIVYDQLAGYLHSERLRWSFGAIRRTPGDWASELARRPPAEALPALATAGFAGIEVDRFGYDDGAKALERDLSRRLRVRPLESIDRRRVFYDLRPFADRVGAALPPRLIRELRQATLHPPSVRWTADFHGAETDGRLHWRWSRRPLASFRLENPAAAGQDVLFVAGMTMGDPGGVAVEYPDGARQVVRPGPGGRRISHALRLPQGGGTVRIRTTSAPARPAPGDSRRDLFVRVIDADVVPTILRRVARRLSQTTTARAGSA